LEDIFKKNVEQILVKVWIVQQMGLSLQYQITKKLNHDKSTKSIYRT
jgi:hypothetical protein